MTTNQTLYFNCPGCDGRFSQIEEPDKDLYTGEVYHCFECGDPVVFQALSLDEYVPPPTAREDCTYCNEYRPAPTARRGCRYCIPKPRKLGPSTSTGHESHVKGDTPCD